MSIHIFYLLISVVLDIMANLSISLSKGFKNKRWGLIGILLIMIAFAMLAFTLQGMPLFIAYSIWGTLSIVGTAIATWLILGQAMNKTIAFGILILVAAVIMMQY